MNGHSVRISLCEHSGERWMQTSRTVTLSNGMHALSCAKRSPLNGCSVRGRPEWWIQKGSTVVSTRWVDMDRVGAISIGPPSPLQKSAIYGTVASTCGRVVSAIEPASRARAVKPAAVARPVSRKHTCGVRNAIAPSVMVIQTPATNHRSAEAARRVAGNSLSNLQEVWRCK